MNYDIFVLEHELNLAGMNIATTEYTEEEGLEGYSDSDDEDEVEERSSYDNSSENTQYRDYLIW